MTRGRSLAPHRLAAGALAAALAIAGCAPSQHALRRPVSDELARRLGGAPELRGAADPAVARAIGELLARPLDAGAAVRVAIANSARVQAALAELGVAGGELAAALAPGPTEVDATYRRGGGGHDLDVTVIQDLIGLVSAPRRRAAARAELAAARANAAATVLRLAARVEIAFHDLLAAQQELELRRGAFDAADAAALLRERMFAAGNATALAQARDRDAREQTRIDVVRAEAAVGARREAVNALLGLSGAQTGWTAAGRLADVPAEPPALDGLEADAVAASLDVGAARSDVEAAAHRAADARVRAIVPSVGVGLSVNDHDFVGQVGPALRLGVPWLDGGAGRSARARAEHRRSEHALAAVAVELRATARAARIAALAAHQEARQLHQVVLPLRQLIVAETLAHYNAMNADPFAVIVARRELVDAGHRHVEALRRYANAMTRVTALRRGVALELALDVGVDSDGEPSPAPARSDHAR